MTCFTSKSDLKNIKSKFHIRKRERERERDTLELELVRVNGDQLIETSSHGRTHLDQQSPKNFINRS